jgi:hypothetical protein
MAFEKQVANTAKSIGIPLSPNVKFPKTKMAISLSQKRRADTGQMNAVITLKGTDYLSDVEIADNSLQGTILYDTLIHPRAFPGTRIAAFAGLFDKYVYRRFTVKFNPSADATDGGIIVGFCDYDPDEDMINQFVENVRKAASHFGMSFTQVFKPDSWTLKELKKDALYFCEPSDSEDRVVYQGRFLLIQAANEGIDFLNGIKGILTVDYEIDFYVPQLADIPPLTQNAICEFDGDLTSETAALPFGSDPTKTTRSNVDVLYSAAVYAGTTYGQFTLPNVPTTTTWLIVASYAATTLTGPVLNKVVGGTLTQLTAFQGSTVNGATSIGIYYYTQTPATEESKYIVPAFTTFGTASQVRMIFIPLPTAILLQHNNRKELMAEVDDLKTEVEEFRNLIERMQISDVVSRQVNLPLTPQQQDNNAQVVSGNPSRLPVFRKHTVSS